MQFEAAPIIVYKGYVDDERNTDNAWFETVVHLFIILNKDLDDVKLTPLDGETDEAEWMTMYATFQMFASHFDFVVEAKKYIEEKHRDIKIHWNWIPAPASGSNSA